MQQVVVGIISQEKNGLRKYLLVKSNKNFGKFTGCWYPPGGHLEKNEDEESALIREIKEELNLQIEPIKKIAETVGDMKENTYWWECNLLSNEMIMDNTEISEAGWFAKEAMRNMQLWPATRYFFEKYIFSQN